MDSISDIPFGKGYGLVSKEFDECLRSIVMMDYGLILISHATDKVFKDEAGNEYNKIVPTLDKRANNIVIRSQKEQLVIENIKRTKQINHNYFEKLNNINCYYLGFLYADGTVRKNRNEIKICLASIDYDF